jgi:NADH:ubiquinone oxidoreductase subunit K
VLGGILCQSGSGKQAPVSRCSLRSPHRRPAMLLNQFLILAAAMFALGIYGLLVRRNIVLILLSVELMLAAVNINLIAFESVLRSPEAIGQVFAIFVITVAAAEVGIGLSIVLMIFRNRKSANVDELDLMRW